MKRLFCILLLLTSIINISFARSKKEEKYFSLIYLFQKGYGENAVYLIYNGEQLISDLKYLNTRKILEIKLDRNNKDSVLFAEQIDNLYRVIRLNYITNKETVLFEFEQEIYSFSAFTENTFFWCERCEKSREPHILYEYDSRTKKIKKLYEVEDIRKSPEYSYEARFITQVQPDDYFIYFYMDGGFVGDSGNYVIDRQTGAVKKNEIDLGWSWPSGRYKNKLIRQGASVSRTDFTKYYKSESNCCVIFDITTFEEVQCSFKKRYERMAGPLILLSDDYFLVPLCITPLKDSWNNGLFGNNWTVCFTVFDIKNNKSIFNGIKTETKIMHLLDAVLI